jgi:D-glycero-D-manno-heptose 1,7-bisphosphate phosphatase
MHPAIFLDRDGVIIENSPSYIRSWADVILFPQALAALARIQASPFKIVIVTNQSVVGRKLISESAAWDINQRLLDVIRESGGRVDGVFICPHAPEDLCDCRKPKPGLLLEAANSLSLDRSRSVMIGDALSDLLAGRSAGIPHNFLVRTGRGAAQALLPIPPDLQPLRTFETLSDALAEIVKN